MTVPSFVSEWSVLTAEKEWELLSLRSHSCFFTGHRVLPDSQIGSLPERLDRVISHTAQNGFDSFLCGGARGFDLLAAASVLRQKNNYPGLRLFMIIPCRGQCGRWTAKEIHLYELLCSQAECILLEDNYSEGCMQRRNRFLVDHASYGIAFCYLETRSGSSQTLRYAEKHRTDYINLATTLL